MCQDPVRLHEKACDEHFDEGVLPEAFVSDVMRARLVCSSCNLLLKAQEALRHFETTSDLA